jgi:hypothetical protein
MMMRCSNRRRSRRRKNNSRTRGSRNLTQEQTVKQQLRVGQRVQCKVLQGMSLRRVMVSSHHQWQWMQKMAVQGTSRLRLMVKSHHQQQWMQRMAAHWVMLVRSRVVVKMIEHHQTQPQHLRQRWKLHLRRQKQQLGKMRRLSRVRARDQKQRHLHHQRMVTCKRSRRRSRQLLQVLVMMLKHRRMSR